jgi:hypothetical protein
MTLAPFVISFLGWDCLTLAQGPRERHNILPVSGGHSLESHLVNYRSTMAKNELLERVRELVEVLQITSE